MTTATATLTGYDPELLEFLDQRKVRYEVIDGSLVVTPPPTFDHERFVIRIGAALDQAAPDDVAVTGSGYAFHYEPGSFLMADVTVARSDDCKRTGMFVAPLLVVEILSKSTRRRDLARKREIYEEAGVPSYWVVDPDASTVTVLELQQDRYAEVLRSPLDHPVTVAQPFPLTFTALPSTR